ncbi:MAG: hypothetical protein WD512_17880 [Candidatus Paceibacterota bacterium]
MNNVLLYVIYHDEKSYEICFNQLGHYYWIKFIKIETTKYCESIFFDYLLKNNSEWKNYEFVGMITYSFASKIEISTLLDANKKITEGNFKGYDIIGLRKLKYGIGEQSQIGITKHLVTLMETIGNSLPNYENNSFERKEREEKEKGKERERDGGKEKERERDGERETEREREKEREGERETDESREIPIVLTKDAISANYTQKKANNLNSLCTLMNKNKNKKELIENQTQKPVIFYQEMIKIPEKNDDKLDWKPLIEKVTPFYSNYWIARPKFLTSFLQWAKIAKDVLDKDPVLAEENSKYKANSKDLIPIFGCPYMTWHPFIMERLICIYVYLVNARLYTYETTIKVENNKKTFGLTKIKK